MKNIESGACHSRNGHVNSSPPSIEHHKDIIHLSSRELETRLSHTIGNTLNELIFGITYEENDKVWKRIQHLREEGIKVSRCQEIESDRKNLEIIMRKIVP